ncbi:hypothetical protein [Microbispora sp. NBRC 16548]|uniref:hypothetical protein n=1 Tax=Microbispora sp. NBRC 16548 TaxID=3030994 RepID=UPI0024A24DA6|nr:hypothetical protein [Microbispora sp. NBRC 16548]GLX08226.1 hypothetical protein Misp03_51520 [Microbispora sp. NBRC 16548]
MIVVLPGADQSTGTSIVVHSVSAGPWPAGHALQVRGGAAWAAAGGTATPRNADRADRATGKVFTRWAERTGAGLTGWFVRFVMRSPIDHDWPGDMAETSQNKVRHTPPPHV